MSLVNSLKKKGNKESISKAYIACLKVSII